MAVYTPVSAELLADFLTRYDVGELVSSKGIAEGVENTNYLVDTTTGRFILTLYEKRVDGDDLPYFMALLDHLAARGNPVPPAIKDRAGVAIQTLAGRPACLIQFLPGVSVTHPNAAQARAAGQAMGRMHAALADFAPIRANSMGVATWQPLFERCGLDLEAIEPGLYARAGVMLESVLRDWPADLPSAPIHADLFPDNVLMRGDRVSGLIDFYFACTDVRALDLAILHTSWSFDADGRAFEHEVGRALVEGYDESFGLTDPERAALGTLAKGACLRFFLSRAWDWLNTPADALVTRKDPLAYLRRYEAYASDDLFA
jgi:homoserine kinase type II